MHAARTGVAARRAAIDGASLCARSALVAVVAAAVVAAVSGRPEIGGGFRLGSGHEVTALQVFIACQIARYAAGALFLMWVYRAVSNATLLGATLKWGPGQAVLACVVPVVSLVLPYYVMGALYRASDPSPLADAPMFRERAGASYREGAREPLAPPRWNLPAPILAWCIFFDARMVAERFARPIGGASVARCIGAACELAAGVLCVLVVRSVDARQRERCRRLQAAEVARGAI